MRIPALAAAAVLVLGLAACGNDTGTTPAQTPAPAPATTGATTAPEESPEATATATVSATATATATAEAVDQSTPEALGETALRAFGANDPEAVCQVVAAGGQPVAATEQGMQACIQTLGGLIGQLPESQRPLFEDPAVTGVTVDGDTASFADAEIQPQVASPLLSQFSAVRIDGDWYLTN